MHILYIYTYTVWGTVCNLKRGKMRDGIAGRLEGERMGTVLDVKIPCFRREGFALNGIDFCVEAGYLTAL